MNEATVVENEGKSKLWPLVFLILAIAYDVMPVDVIPDIPVIGWVDDFFVTVTAALNLIQQSILGTNTALGRLVMYAKWGVILLGVIAVTLIIAGVFGAVGLVKMLAS